MTGLCFDLFSISVFGKSATTGGRIMGENIRNENFSFSNRNSRDFSYDYLNGIVNHTCHYRANDGLF
jgi:hypothetical protein